MDVSLVVMALGASFAAGLATGLGAVSLLLFPQMRQATQHAMLGFAAGAMVAASFLSLLIPAHRQA
jgi:zinc transporter, ZIP family